LKNLMMGLLLLSACEAPAESGSYGDCAAAITAALNFEHGK
jgi:hypothetical protein